MKILFLKVNQKRLISNLKNEFINKIIKWFITQLKNLNKLIKSVRANSKNKFINSRKSSVSIK